MKLMSISHYVIVSDTLKWDKAV